MSSISHRGLVFVVIVCVITGLYVPGSIDSAKADLEDGLVDYWNFDEGSEDANHDISGYCIKERLMEDNR